MTEEKKKRYYYYGGKEKKAGEIKKRTEEEMAQYSIQRDFDRMMERFQREFEDFWEMPPRLRHWMRMRPGLSMMPFREMAMPSVDVEDRGKDFHVIADLPGFEKDNVDIEVSEDSVTIKANRMQNEEEKNKNYVRHERSRQTFYRRIELPEKVRSDDAKASLNNGILDIVLPKKEPKESKKLTIA